MQNLIFSPIPVEQLKAEVSETIKKELQSFLQSIQPQKEQAEFLSRKEAGQLLSVSLVTLNEWTKTGIVQGYRIASRVRYKRAEIETALKKMNTGKK